MGENTWRLFVAIDTPPEVKAAITDLQRRLQAADADIRWERADKFHLTLKFLGETRADLVERIIATLRETARSFPRINVVYGSPGFFPTRGDPRVVWVGMTEHGESLGRLYDVLQEQFAAIGFPKDDRTFHPHVTIGRVRSMKGISALRRSVESLTFESQPVIISSIELINSVLKSDGSVYSTIAHLPLQSDTTR